MKKLILFILVAGELYGIYIMYAAKPEAASTTETFVSSGNVAVDTVKKMTDFISGTKSDTEAIEQAYTKGFLTIPVLEQSLEHKGLLSVLAVPKRGCPALPDAQSVNLLHQSTRPNFKLRISG